jgi:LppP/LprE lipoprotein
MKLISLLGALGVGAACAAGIAACGSSNASNVSLPTVTITTPAGPPSATDTQPPATETTAPTTTTTIPTVTSPPAQTRTATAPAFTQTSGGTSADSGDLLAAVTTLKARGYEPVSTSTYDANETLRVVIGANGGAEQAFFFDGPTYLGTDTKDPSRSISVTGQTDTEVTLRYGTTNGSATVRFELDMGQLTPLDTIPSASSRAPS